MFRVLVTVRMDEERRDALAAASRRAFEAVILEDLSPAGRDRAWSTADAVLCIGFPSEFPADVGTKALRLRMVQTLVAGVDHLPFDRLPSGIVVCSNAGAYNTSVAEHAMALLLAAAKDIPARTEEIRRGIFDQDVVNKGLAGGTVLILGMGGIGSEVARRCKAFDMHVVGVSRTRAAGPSVDGSGTLEDLPRLLPSADAVVVCLPLTQATDGLVDRRFLAAMKQDAVLVNIARGKIVVEDDLFEHLKAHPRFRAALDVWWSYPDGKEGRPYHRPFHELPNVVLTPHIAHAIPGQRRLAMVAAAENLARFARGEPLRNRVDPAEYTRRRAIRGPG